MSGGVRPTRRFTGRRLTAIATTKYLYLRAGETHRFVPVWVVVVDGRVLVRSWNDRPDGWYRAFLRERRGAIRLDSREIAVRAVPVRGSRIDAGAERAYGEKYTTKANRVYVRGFATGRRRAHTLELLPGGPGAAAATRRSPTPAGTGGPRARSRAGDGNGRADVADERWRRRIRSRLTRPAGS
jgi:hypothetical protein